MAEAPKRHVATISQPRSALFKKVLDILRKAEPLSATALQRAQRQLLAPLLVHVHAHAPAYRTRLMPLFTADGDIDWSRWRDVPILTRANLAEEVDRLSCRSVPRSHGAVGWGASSGTTGRPVRYKFTQLCSSATTAANQRLYEWHDLDGNATLARIRPSAAGVAAYPKGRPAGRWAYGGEGSKPEGRHWELNINTPIHEQAEWLARIGADYLNTFASNAHGLAEHARQHPEVAVALGLKRILTYGESVSDDLRERCLESLGAPVIDCYSSLECGMLALQCNQGSGYHIQSELALIELLDPQDRPVAPGELGRVVVTTIWNYATPLIRYDTLDLAVAGVGCPCGRSAPTLSLIAGRSRNLFRFPGNVVIQPDFKTATWEKFLKPLQWQVAQTGPFALEVRFVPREDAASADFEGMTAYIRDLLRQNVSVEYRAVEEISKASSGKYEDYICELTRDADVG